MKLDRNHFDKPIDANEPSKLCGSFAKVLKRTLDTKVRFSTAKIIFYAIDLHTCMYQYIYTYTCMCMYIYIHM